MDGFIAVALSAKLLLDAHRVKSPGVLQRNISIKLVFLTLNYIKKAICEGLIFSFPPPCHGLCFLYQDLFLLHRHNYTQLMSSE